jgi:hypothetical protein
VGILKGETSAAEAARKHGLTLAEVEDWRDRFLAGAENALRTRPNDEDALKDEQIKKLKQKIGGARHYQVEVPLVEETDRYLHVMVAVDEGTLPSSLVPLTPISCA